MDINFPVSEKKLLALRNKMKYLGILESDLDESFTRGSGNGGQNVNKVSTAVRLNHKPSGEEIKCSVYRTQGLNRYKARAILCERIELKKLGKGSTQGSKISKIQKSKKDKLRKLKKKLVQEAEVQNREIDY
ncbi:MAG: peptide chain release factor-like protein [Leptospira sp.]|nr:peptide chain release factor-like protein [Leptospira sp.]NCS92548.1 peptide chain release factor-like protein [Leptospira sp.]